MQSTRAGAAADRDVCPATCGPEFMLINAEVRVAQMAGTCGHSSRRADEASSRRLLSERRYRLPCPVRIRSTCASGPSQLGKRAPHPSWRPFLRAMQPVGWPTGATQSLSPFEARDEARRPKGRGAPRQLAVRKCREISRRKTPDISEQRATGVTPAPPARGASCGGARSGQHEIHHGGDGIHARRALTRCPRAHALLREPLRPAVARPALPGAREALGQHVAEGAPTAAAPSLSSSELRDQTATPVRRHLFRGSWATKSESRVVQVVSTDCPRAAASVRRTFVGRPGSAGCESRVEQSVWTSSNSGHVIDAVACHLESLAQCGTGLNVTAENLRPTPLRPAQGCAI
ncbi:hypothetical protein MYXA107069_33250 [Myxococcus xanthus]|nr:hypothetical protein MyxoNM_38510 [Myxococcus xanthus]SDX40702.1 hypothetical protein SAMN05444383_107343 [Myxococcus xanthus]